MWSIMTRLTSKQTRGVSSPGAPFLPPKSKGKRFLAMAEYKFKIGQIVYFHPKKS